MDGRRGLNSSRRKTSFLSSAVGSPSRKMGISFAKQKEPKGIAISNKSRTFASRLLSIFDKSADGNHISTLISQWEGKEVLFPKNMVFTRFASDTIDYTIPDSTKKVIVYVDSIGCISCKLQLHKWESFIKQVDSISGSKIPFIFIFQPQNKAELRKILQIYQFSLPVCIDEEGTFNSLNHFPNEMEFQTFLLDEENKVIAIGNPIHNLNIRDLYLRKLTGAISHDVGTTIVRLDSLQYDLGILHKGQKIQHTIKLHNIGEGTFYLNGITVSCDCMKVGYDWDSLSVGQKTDITFSYKAEESGEFIRTITIYGNIPNSKIDIDIIGITGF